jgi:hypothetical protein
MHDCIAGFNDVSSTSDCVKNELFIVELDTVVTWLPQIALVIYIDAAPTAGA